jgi:hypothetical protein
LPTNILTVHKLLRLSNDDLGVVRVANNLIDSKRESKSCFYRRDNLKIVNKKNGRWVIRSVMGNPGTIKHLDAKSIALDYDAADQLRVRYGDVELIVTRAKWYEVYYVLWNDKDVSNRVSIRLSLVGCLLGVIGILTAFL